MLFYLEWEVDVLLTNQNGTSLDGRACDLLGRVSPGCGIGQPNSIPALT